MKYIRTKRRSPARLLIVISVLLSITVSLSGCLYSDSEEGQSKVNYRESVKRIQSAVDDFQQEEGILPILNADIDTPRYEKFRIDLDLLNKRGYLDDIPATAFEKGGTAYFLILNEESTPTVKVMDVVTVQKVNDVQLQVTRYMSAHGGELPSGEELYPGLYAVDTKKTGTASIKLYSVYSGEQIPLMLDKKGTVYVDYVFDLMSVINKNGVPQDKNEDLRLILEQASYYVPVKSLPYLWINEQPVPQPPQ